MPAFAESFPSDGYMLENKTYSGAATEENMGAYSGTVTATAEYEDILYQIGAGTYLPAGATVAKQCPANSYCPGVTDATYNASESQGAKSCPSGYPNSAGGAWSNTQCYTACTVSMVEHASAVDGNDYYGTGTDTLCNPYQACNEDTGKCESTCPYEETAATCNAKCMASPTAGTASCQDDRDGDGNPETYYASCGAAITGIVNAMDCSNECKDVNDDLAVCTKDGVTHYSACGTSFQDGETEETCRAKCLGFTAGECYMNGTQYGVCSTDRLEYVTDESCRAKCLGVSGQTCTTGGITYYETCGDSIKDSYTKTTEICSGQCSSVSGLSCTPEGEDVAYYQSCGDASTGDLVTEEDCAKLCKGVPTGSCTVDDVAYYTECGDYLCTNSQYCDTGAEQVSCGDCLSEDHCPEGYTKDLTECSDTTKYFSGTEIFASDECKANGQSLKCGKCSDCDYGTCISDAEKDGYELGKTKEKCSTGEYFSSMLCESDTSESCSNLSYGKCSDCEGTYTCPTSGYSMEVESGDCKTDLLEKQVFRSELAESDYEQCTAEITCGYCEPCNYYCEAEGYTVGLTADDCETGEEYQSGPATSDVLGCSSVSEGCGKCVAKAAECPSDCVTEEPDSNYFSYSAHSTAENCYCSVACNADKGYVSSTVKSTLALVSADSANIELLVSIGI